jgi:trigger factor
MEGWVNVRGRPLGQRHVAKEITLLCDTHHREKTNGLLPLETVRVADADPINLRTGVSKPYDLHYAGETCDLVVGSNLFTRRSLEDGTQLVAVEIDGCPMLAFTFDRGHLFLTLRVYNDAGHLVLDIEENTLIYSIAPWDIRLEGMTLTIREESTKFLTEIVFEPSRRVSVNRGLLQKDGLEFIVAPDMLCYANTQGIIARLQFEGFDVAVSAGKMPEGPIPRTVVVYFPDRNRHHAARNDAKKAMRKFRKAHPAPPSR